MEFPTKNDIDLSNCAHKFATSYGKIISVSSNTEISRTEIWNSLTENSITIHKVEILVREFYLNSSINVLKFPHRNWNSCIKIWNVIQKIEMDHSINVHKFELEALYWSLKFHAFSPCKCYLSQYQNLPENK